MPEQRDLFPRPPLTPTSHLTAGATVGTPLAIVAVWYLNASVLAEPMPDVVSTAVGSIVVAGVGYVMQLLEALLAKLKGET